MTVETMGKPRDMQAFRQRQEGRPDEIPRDVERQNQASLQRNKDADQDSGPAGDVSAPDAVRSVISSSGTSMDETVQREMESKMGGDFSDVQLHTGPDAAAAAESINARAFTVGNHVAFNSGEYQPESDSGKKLLAHELTHVRQQTNGRVSLLPKAGAEHPGTGINGGGIHIQPKLEMSSPNDPAEKEAERVAEKVMKMDDDMPAGVEVDTGLSYTVDRAIHRVTSNTVHRLRNDDEMISEMDLLRREHRDIGEAIDELTQIQVSLDEELEDDRIRGVKDAAEALFGPGPVAQGTFDAIEGSADMVREGGGSAVLGMGALIVSPVWVFAGITADRYTAPYLGIARAIQSEVEHATVPEEQGVTDITDDINCLIERQQEIRARQQEIRDYEEGNDPDATPPAPEPGEITGEGGPGGHPL